MNKNRSKHLAWGFDDIQEVKTDINESIAPQQSKKYPPYGAHIVDMDFGNGNSFTSIHDGQGGNKIIPKHEYHEKHLPHYKKDNPVGTVYHSYELNDHKFITSHGHNGEVVTTGEHIHNYAQKERETTRINPSEHPKGTYENPHRNDGVGQYIKYGADGGSEHFGHYYNEKECLDRNSVNIDHFKKHHDTLDRYDRDTIISYKDSSSGINRKLRSMAHAENRKKKINDNDIYKSLDHVTSAHTIKDMHVYRGFYQSLSREKLDGSARASDFKPGYTFKDHGYTGTSLNAKIPKHYSDNIHHEYDGKGQLIKKRKTIFKIHVPKGTRGHYFDHEPTRYDIEQEFVLHRGSTFKVTHHSMDDDTHFIHVKVVKQENNHPRGEKKLYKESLSYRNYMNLEEGKTIKDRSDHWNWSDKDIEEVKQKTKLIRKKKKEDRSYHWNWSPDDIEEVRPDDVTLHEAPELMIGKGQSYYQPSIEKENLTDKHNLKKNMDHYYKHNKSLSFVHEDIVRSYKQSSANYNDLLRKHKGEIHETGHSKMNSIRKKNPYQAEKHHYDLLDEITSHPSLHDMHLYRGVGDRHTNSKDKNVKTDVSKFKPGYTFKDHGYTSTSIDKHSAGGFSYRKHMDPAGSNSPDYNYTKGSHRSSVFKIHVPAGTKGHYVDHVENDFDHEKEFVLHRGTSFQVTHHSMDNDFHYIHVKVVGQRGDKNIKENINEGKTIKDRSDHWNWSERDIEQVKQKTKLIRKKKKEDRSYHWNWSGDDIEEVRPDDATLHESTKEFGTYEKPQKYKETPTNIIHQGRVVDPVRENLKHYKEHHDKLNFSEDRAIYKYKRDSNDFNGKLRKKEKFDKTGDESDYFGVGSNTVKHFDKVTSHPSLHDMHVYRGVGDNHGKQRTNLSKFKPGYTFKDHGYTGTSLDKNMASNFSQRVHGHDKKLLSGYDVETNPKHKNSKLSIFKIHMPAGTKGHYVDHRSSPFSVEKEFVLHRGTTFKVTHHSVDDKHHYIHVKVVKQENHYKPIASKKLNDDRKRKDDIWES